MITPNSFPSICPTAGMPFLSTCRRLMEFGQRLFRIYTIDAIPPLQESAGKPIVHNPPSLFVYLHHCIENFQSFMDELIHTLRLPYMKDPHFLSTLFGSNRFLMLRELRLTCLESLGFVLTRNITCSSTLTTLGVSNPGDRIFNQLSFAFPSLESLTIRDVKYTQLDDLFNLFEDRFKVLALGKCSPLKRLSVIIQPKYTTTNPYSTFVGSGFSRVILLRQFLSKLQRKAKTVFSTLKYLHLSVVGHEDIIKNYLTELSELANNTNSSCFAPCTTVDFGFSSAELKTPHNNVLSIGHQVIGMVDILDKHYRISITPPKCLSYSTRIMFRTYEDLFALFRSGMTEKLLKTLSDLDLRLRILKLPLCVNLRSANPNITRKLM